jgi:hypothetical protein
MKIMADINNQGKNFSWKRHGNRGVEALRVEKMGKLNPFAVHCEPR